MREEPVYGRSNQSLIKGGVMSAYVVENKTINKVVNWLEYQVRYDRGDFISSYWLKMMFSELGYDLEKKRRVFTTCRRYVQIEHTCD